MLQGLGLGRIVHYTLRESDVADLVFPVPLDEGADRRRRLAGQVRPAIVVNTWPGLGREDGYANLQVLTDGPNDGFPRIAPLLWVTSVTFSEGGEPGTWTWPSVA